MPCPVDSLWIYLSVPPFGMKTCTSRHLYNAFVGSIVLHRPPASHRGSKINPKAVPRTVHGPEPILDKSRHPSRAGKQRMPFADTQLAGCIAP